MNYFIILLVIILVLIYLSNFITNENFTIGYDPNSFNYANVDYNTREQNCDELTYTPEECIVDTVIPTNEIVCNESLTPITNNEKNCNKNKKNTTKTNPTLSLTYDFDLLPSFNESQIDKNTNIKSNNDLDELETFGDLKTDVRSLASLENDLMTNY